MLVGGGGGVGMTCQASERHYADWLNKFKWSFKWIKLPETRLADKHGYEKVNAHANGAVVRLE